MNDVYKNGRELLEKEFEKIIDKGDVSPTELDRIYKVVDIIKDIGEICEEDVKAANGYDMDYSGRRSYNNMGGGYGQYQSYAMNQGRYANGRNGGSSSYGYGSSRNSTIDHLQSMVNNARNDQERMMYQRWLDEAEQNY